MTDEEFAAWPKCLVPACRNKCCLRLTSRYCWPHTPGTPKEAAENLAETEALLADIGQKAQQEAALQKLADLSQQMGDEL